MQRGNRFEDSLNKLANQRNAFTKLYTLIAASMRTSLISYSHKIPKNIILFADGKFIIECLVGFALAGRPL